MARNRRCRNCPDPTPVAKSQSATNKYTGKKLDQSLVTRSGESSRLWHHVLFGTGTCIEMIEGYASLGLPGDPLPTIKQLIERLSIVATKLEERNANHAT